MVETLSKEQVVHVVVQIYRVCCREMRGVTGYPKVPERGTELFENCFQFWLLSLDVKPTLKALMSEAVGFYGDLWCAKVVKRPYPPLTFVVSAQSRNRVMRNNRPRVKPKGQALESEGRALALTLVNAIGEKGVREILDGGWPADELLRAEIRRNL